MPKIPIKIIGNETEKSKECRTIVYIDGQNFLHRCTESLIYSGAITSQRELYNIDLRFIFNKFLLPSTYEIRFYGVAKVKIPKITENEVNEQYRKIVDNLRRVRTNFVKQGVILKDVGQLKIRETKPCKKCGYILSELQEKGVDVGLASELVKDAALGLVDKIVLASSDIDMLPAVKIARQLGKKVTYVGFKYQLTNAIVKRTDDIFEINRLVVLEAYTSALNQLLDKHSTIEI